MAAVKRDAGTLEHLYKVHLVAGLGLASAAVGCHLHMNDTLPGGDHMTIAQVVLGLVVAASHTGTTDNGLSLWRTAVLMLFGLCAGANVGTWVEAALQDAGLCRGSGFAWLPDLDSLWSTSGSSGVKCDLNSQLMGDAFAVTAVIYGCFFVAGLVAPTEKLFWLASAAEIAVLALTAHYWLARFGFGFFARTFETVYVQAGLVVYAGKVAVDTGMIMAKYAAGDRDVVAHALTQLTNVLQLFIRVITILAKLSKESKKEKRR